MVWTRMPLTYRFAVHDFIQITSEFSHNIQQGSSSGRHVVAGKFRHRQSSCLARECLVQSKLNGRPIQPLRRKREEKEAR